MRAWAWAMVVHGSMLSAAAWAQPETSVEAVVRVEPDARGCVTKAALQARVHHWLKAYTPLDDVAVEVRAAARPPAFVVLRGGAIVAERRFPVLPTQCRDRLDALALAVALALENAAHIVAQSEPATDAPSRVVNGAEAGRELAPSQPLPPRVAPAQPSEPPFHTPISPQISSTPAPVPTPPPVPPPHPTPAPPTPVLAPTRVRAPTPARTPAPALTLDSTRSVSQHTAKLAFRFHTGIAVIDEVLPAPAPVLQAGAELVMGPSRRFSVAVEGLITSQIASALAGAESHSQLFAGRALACWEWPLGDLAPESCAGGAVGAVAAKGNGFMEDRPTTLLWVAGIVRLALRYPREGTFSVRLAADGLVNVERPRLVVQTPDGSVTSAPTKVGGAAALALCISVP